MAVWPDFMFVPQIAMYYLLYSMHRCIVACIFNKDLRRIVLESACLLLVYDLVDVWLFRKL